jgi:hypothetical protein
LADIEALERIMEERLGRGQEASFRRGLDRPLLASLALTYEQRLRWLDETRAFCARVLGAAWQGTRTSECAGESSEAE